MDVIFERERGKPFSIEVGYFDTVLEIKQSIEKYMSIPVSIQTLSFNGTILQDDHNIEQCQILDGSRIQLLFAPEYSTNSFDRNGVLPSSAPNNGVVIRSNGQGLQPAETNPRKLTVFVSLKGESRKTPVEVNPTDNVGELRNELARLNQRLELNLPEDRYIFIHKQNVMDGDRSFLSYRVAQNDTIDIFYGSVSDGT